MTRVLVRDAVPADMTALSGVYRRSSLSNEGDRPNLLAHPETLEFSDLGVREGRTRAAIAEGGIGRVEVTANPHALAFYEKAGFVVYREVATRFRTAPRMRLDVTA